MGCLDNQIGGSRVESGADRGVKNKKSKFERKLIGYDYLYV